MALRMIHRYIFTIICLLLQNIVLLPSALADELITLCYHDVRDDVDGHLDADTVAVSSKQLAEQFEWLRQNGYTPVSVNQLEDARLGKKSLPSKAVLLSFDDGYESFYTRVFPLLKLYGYPAVMAVVGRWLDLTENRTAQGSAGSAYIKKGLSAEEIREMQASGLIEFASHSYDSHRGVLANPQGNEEPAMVTRLFDAKRQRYETEQQAYQRIFQDVQRSSKQLQKLTGVAPRVMVWPYGAWNIPAENAARAVGFRWFFTLGREPIRNRISASGRIERHMLASNPSLSDFKEMLKPYRMPVSPVRAAHVDLDYVYDADPVRLNSNLDKLLNRIQKLHISTVYLQAFADPDGDGNASAVYFPNRHLPVRADLFNRVAWQLKTRAGVDVYAWMPVLAFDFGKDFYRIHGIRQWREQGVPVAPDSAYQRLSLFDPLARQRILDLYSDLAAHANFQGVLFHDDAIIDTDEDFHPQAVQWFSQRGVQLNNYAQWKDDAIQRKRFTYLKVQALDAFTQNLAEAVKVYRPEIRTARNFYAETALNPQSVDWFAQSMETALLKYDYVALMAMPWMEEAEDPEQWTKNLIKKLEYLSPAQKNRFVVELQARDWRTGEAINNRNFSQQVKLWSREGYLNFAWYPDDFHANIPDFDTVFKALSLQDYPYERR